MRRSLHIIITRKKSKKESISLSRHIVISFAYVFIVCIKVELPHCFIRLINFEILEVISLTL